MGALATSNPGFWIKADAITGLADGATITSVTDNGSGAHNATTRTGTVIYKTGISPTGLPVMRFNGSSTLGVTADILQGSASSAVFVIDQNGAPSITQGLLSSDAGSGCAFVVDPNPTGLALVSINNTVACSAPAGSVNTTKFSVVIYTFNAGAYTFYVDGVVKASGTSAITSFTAGSSTAIGYYNSEASDLVGDVGETATWARALTSTEVSNITTELTSKWIAATSGGTVAATSSVTGSATGLYRAGGTVVGTSGISGAATLQPVSTGGVVTVLSSAAGAAALLTAPRYSFIPPIVQEGSDDPFFGRYLTNVGQSVVLTGGHYVTMPYPWLGELVGLTEGRDYFLGGRVYAIDPATASALNADGYTTITS